MAWKTYEDLTVFKKSYDLALRIHRSTLSFPVIEQYSLTAQIRRSSKSVCANIAEGHGKSSLYEKDFIRFLSMVIGSAEETRLWLKFCYDLQYISDAEWQDYINDATEVIKMLHGLIKSILKEDTGLKPETNNC
jgi:four helix bundle protein